MSVITNNLLLGEDGYNISRSVRLRSSATGYFSRTPASATNQKTWTWSGWVKRGVLGSSSSQSLFCADVSNSGTNLTLVEFGNDTLLLQYYLAGSYNLVWQTAAVFRDPSAWYHVVVVLDTTQASSSNAVKIYVNGVLQTSTFTAYTGAYSQNMNFVVNYNTGHLLGNGNALAYKLDGYLTEINFIDGQALTSSSFGENDSITGVWKPKKYAGTYGTNGFYLKFDDPSAATAAAIGKDSSGNGNNWTPNNISVTSGVAYDSMLDVPTMWADGGNGRGNYAVLNPLVVSNAAPISFSEANLRVDFGSSSTGWAHSSIGIVTGKWYAEFTLASVSSTNASVGLKSDTSLNYAGFSSNSYAYENSGSKRTNDTTSSYGSSFTNGDVIGVAYDADAGTLTFYKNNTTQGQAFSGITGTNYFVVSDISSSPTCVWQANFGQRPFAYTPPTGFKALNTQNLPDATIKKGNAYFDATTYTGNGSTQTITNSGSMQPDLLWAKARSTATHGALVDSVRGVDKYLYSSLTIAEETQTNALSSFNSNGFSLAGSFGNVNANGTTYVGWQWKESVSAGFDIVTYTGTGANRTVAHSLGVAPSLIILKQRSTADYWTVWHSSIANTEYLLLNSTNGKSTAATYWNSTSPTSSVFSLGTDSRPNGSGVTYVAYLFAEVAGFSKFGSYTGNGSADGPFVFTGFRPRWVMVKRTDAVADWYVIDTSRDTYNLSSAILYPNLSNAEASNGLYDYLSNGFKLRNAGSAVNASGGTYIYAAFAENPFKYSLGR